MRCNLIVSAVLLFACSISILLSPSSAQFPCRSNLAYDFRNIDRFTDNMCAQCLWYMAGHEVPWNDFETVHHLQVLYNHSDTVNVLLCTHNCTEFKYDHLKEPNNYIVKEFKSKYYLDLLFDCCEQARQCCNEMLQKDFDSKQGHCPSKWDGFMCWDSAKAGTISYKACPSMTYFTLGIRPTPCRNEIANKECLPNSTWARIWKPTIENNQSIISSEEYTNYLPCSTPGATHRLIFIRVSIGVYVLSLGLSLVGLSLLKYFPIQKQPKLCIIHVNFLRSLIFTSVFSLGVLIFIKEQHYKLNSMIDKNPYWCRLLMILMKTARLTNYCWMLNEGIILWQMIVFPFRINNIKMFKFLFIGWIMPIIIMVIYSIVHSLPQYNRSCWTQSMGFLEWIYTAPPITFIMINVLLLIHMTVIIVKKLNESQNRDFKSGFKAFLVLVPIFGLQYILYIVPFDPFESCAVYLFICHYILIITEALQGAIVTIIFCFCNKEIQNNILISLKKRGYLQKRYKYTDSSVDKGTELEVLNKNRRK